MGHVVPHPTRSTPLALSDYKQPRTETTNRHMAKNDEAFIGACVEAGVQATGRQYGKWSRGVGRARLMSKSGKRINNDGTEI